MGDPGEYREGGIWASTENVKSGRVPERVGSEQVSEMGDPSEYLRRWDLGEYRKCGIWAIT